MYRAAERRALEEFEGRGDAEVARIREACQLAAASPAPGED
jgi:hypothetical protein